MRNENYPMTNIQCALRISESLQREIAKNNKIDLIATAYAIFNRVLREDGLSHAAADPEPDYMGDFSSHNSEPCFESLSIVAGIFAGHYEDPTNGATRFHRHDQCPGWAENMQPCALLGPFLYYRD